MKFGATENPFTSYLSELGHDILELRDLLEAAHLLVHDGLEAGDERAVAGPLRRHRAPHRNSLYRASGETIY